MRRTLICSLTLVSSLIAGCYAVEFDENMPNVYYCMADSDCGADQACERFRCVADIGPQVRISLPEPLTPIPNTDPELIVDYAFEDFEISDSNQNVEGQGKILVSIDNLPEFSTLADDENGVAVDISAGLPPGAHRLWAQAVYGDGTTPYENPGATAYTMFFVTEPDSNGGDQSKRPQIAIVRPGPNYVHVVGEPLEVELAVRNFTITDSGNDCHIDEGCDPWATPDCAACPLTTQGHAHIYIEPDYPGCLLDQPIGCNGDYVLSLRPSESDSATNTSVTATLSAEAFEQPGTITFSASLQYSDHDPYPTKGAVIFDQITFEVVD